MLPHLRRAGEAFGYAVRHDKCHDRRHESHSCEISHHRQRRQLVETREFRGRKAGWNRPHNIHPERLLQVSWVQISTAQGKGMIDVQDRLCRSDEREGVRVYLTVTFYAKRELAEYKVHDAVKGY